VNAQLRVKCPSCGKALTVPSSAIGRQGTCPGCKSKITIESPTGNSPAVKPRPSKSEPEIIEAELAREPAQSKPALTVASELLWMKPQHRAKYQSVLLFVVSTLGLLLAWVFAFPGNPRLRNLPVAIMMLVVAPAGMSLAVWLWRRKWPEA
jgi:ribosomal protein S27E